MAQPAGQSWENYLKSIGAPAGTANPITSGWTPQGNPSPPGRRNRRANRKSRRANRKSRRVNRKNRRNTMRRRR